MSALARTSRREFIRKSVLAGGGLALGVWVDATGRALGQVARS
jgi:hypothetical protein